MFVSRGDFVWPPGFCSFVPVSLLPESRIPPPGRWRRRGTGRQREALPQSLRDSSLREGAKGTRLEENSVSLPREGGGGDSRRRE